MIDRVRLWWILRRKYKYLDDGAVIEYSPSFTLLPLEQLTSPLSPVTMTTSLIPPATFVLRPLLIPSFFVLSGKGYLFSSDTSRSRTDTRRTKALPSRSQHGLFHSGYCHRHHPVSSPVNSQKSFAAATCTCNPAAVTSP